MLEGDVGGDDNGAMLVAFGDELEQQLSTSRGEGIRQWSKPECSGKRGSSAVHPLSKVPPFSGRQHTV